MGCHTWFFNKREKQSTIEEAKEYIFNKIEENMLIAKNILDKQKKGKVEKILWDVCNKNYDEVMKYYKHYKEEKKKLNNASEEEILYKFMNYSMWDKNICPSGLATFYNGCIYDKIPKMYEYFRVPHYPEDILTNYEEFEMFYLNNFDKCYSDMFDNEEDIRNAMKKFWEDYPNGIVHFG